MRAWTVEGCRGVGRATWRPTSRVDHHAPGAEPIRYRRSSGCSFTRRSEQGCCEQIKKFRLGDGQKGQKGSEGSVRAPRPKVVQRETAQIRRSRSRKREDLKLKEARASNLGARVVWSMCRDAGIVVDNDTTNTGSAAADHHSYLRVRRGADKRIM